MGAPADSLAFRTLDQQCTVTRPGLAALASSIAVELIAALTQHCDGFSAPSTVTSGPGLGTALSSAAAQGARGGKMSLLGAVPHQVRGYLADFRLAPAETEPFDRCICCSKAVLDRFREEGNEFVDRVIADSKVLEQVSGLAEMKSAVCEDDVLSFDDFDED